MFRREAMLAGGGGDLKESVGVGIPWCIIVACPSPTFCGEGIKVSKFDSRPKSQLENASMGPVPRKSSDNGDRKSSEASSLRVPEWSWSCTDGDSTSSESESAVPSSNSSLSQEDSVGCAVELMLGKRADEGWARRRLLSSVWSDAVLEGLSSGETGSEPAFSAALRASYSSCFRSCFALARRF